jgi:alkylhydroperoxidase/carboxymuconolactone decarboxylase family protein YurZ
MVSKMAEDPLKVYQKLDPEIRKWVENLRSFAFKDGALSGKMKILIALALDAAHGSTEGVRALARSAMKAGATKEEIGEALRVTLYVCGVGSAYTAARALSESF